MAKLLMGKEVSARIKAELKTEVENLKKEGINPGLAVIIVGEDPASQVYVRNKERACEECGIYSEKYALPAETTQEELLKLIDELNNKSSISGILVQLPVPKHIDEKTIINAIAPNKDVDAFHPVNVGKIMVGNYDFVPCTPAGVMELIKESGIGIFTARDLNRLGVEEVAKRTLAKVRENTDYVYMTVDIDALDMAYALGSGGQEPAGLTHFQLSDLIKACAPYVDIIDFVEVNPMTDHRELTSHVCANLVLDYIAARYYDAFEK